MYRNSWLPEVFNDFLNTANMPKTNATAPAINVLESEKELLLSGKTQITYKSLRNSLYIGNSAFFFEIQAPLIK